ncbi:MAG: sarcosine oxidase subunit gamma family protein [Pseudomonadota bacterium]
MADLAIRQSALEGRVPAGHIGEPGRTGVHFDVVREVVLWQVAAWPDTLGAVGAAVAAPLGAARAPGPGQSVTGDTGALLRVEPLTWWVLGVEPAALASDQGARVDLSHARTQVRVSGEAAATLLMRHLPLNLNDAAFPVGAVASSAIHHVGVTVWRSERGYELFAPRGFAASVWALLLETAAQFGATAQFVD